VGGLSAPLTCFKATPESYSLPPEPFALSDYNIHYYGVEYNSKTAQRFKNFFVYFVYCIFSFMDFA
jgi:hypothetical protein